MLSRRDKLDEQALTFLQLSTVTINATLLWLLSKWKLWIVDTCTLSVLTVRCIMTWLLFKFTSEGRSGFEHIDIKQLQDSVIFVALPTLLLTNCNWQIDLILTAPILIISNSWTVMSAFSTEGNNMECYADPDSVGGQMSMRWIIFLFVIFYSLYETRNH